MAISSFKRYEKKYCLTAKQKEALINEIKSHMIFDKYCPNETTYCIQNIYLDEDNNALIEKSIAKPKYKEKLRIRKYGTSPLYFLEMKKKIKGIVNKRRLRLTLEEISALLKKEEIPERTSFIDQQVLSEITYFIAHFELKPKVYISYDRLAFFDPNDSQFRITFDSNIRSSRVNLDFDGDHSSDSFVLDPDKCILEIKTSTSFPLWLSECLSKYQIYPHSFSKYGTEFRLLITEGEKNYV